MPQTAPTEIGKYNSDGVRDHRNHQNNDSLSASLSKKHMSFRQISQSKDRNLKSSLHSHSYYESGGKFNDEKDMAIDNDNYNLYDNDLKQGKDGNILKGYARTFNISDELEKADIYESGDEFNSYEELSFDKKPSRRSKYGSFNTACRSNDTKVRRSNKNMSTISGDEFQTLLPSSVGKHKNRNTFDKAHETNLNSSVQTSSDLSQCSFDEYEQSHSSVGSGGSISSSWNDSKSSQILSPIVISSTKLNTVGKRGCLKDSSSIHAYNDNENEKLNHSLDTVTINDEVEFNKSKTLSQQKADEYVAIEYINREAIKPSLSPMKDISIVNNQLYSLSWPDIIDILVLFRRLCLHHQELMSTQGNIAMALRQVIKFADNLRSALAKNSIMAIDDMLFGLGKYLDSEILAILACLLKVSH
jgi:hypothetical protein